MAITESDVPLALGGQLLAALGMLLLVTVIHAFGLMALSSWRTLDDKELDRTDFSIRSLPLLAAVLLSLFAIHLIEIAVFAAFYRIVGGAHSVELALYTSATAYTTIGGPESPTLRPWRLVCALEGLTGFVFITWSTAFIVGIVERLRR